MGRIQFLHISDLHISKTPNLPAIKEINFSDGFERVWNHETLASYDPGILRALKNFIRKRDKELQAVLITGDISTSGLGHDLELALKVIKKINAYVPTFILPGNHDRYKSVIDGVNLFFKPGGKNFHNYFEKYWNSDVRENLPLKNENLTVHIVSADFSLRSFKDSKIQTLGGFYAQGFVYPDILDKLKKTTGHIFNKFGENNNVAVIWALHFPPVAYGIASHSELINSEKLVEAAQEKKILAILSGHTHYKIKESREDLFFLGAGSATQVDGKGKSYSNNNNR